MQPEQIFIKHINILSLEIQHVINLFAVFSFFTSFLTILWISWEWEPCLSCAVTSASAWLTPTGALLQFV